MRQPGNPKPRMFRLPDDEAVINRYGFNSEGHRFVQENMRCRIRKWLNNNHNNISESSQLPSDIPKSLIKGRALGINLGKNKTSAADSNEDYIKGIKVFSFKNIFAEGITLTSHKSRTWVYMRITSWLISVVLIHLVFVRCREESLCID